MEDPTTAPIVDATETHAAPDIFRLVVLFEGGLVVAACIAGLFMEVPPWRAITWQWRQLGIGLAATLPMALLLVLIRAVRTGPLARLNAVVDQLLVPLFARCGLWQLAVIAALAGIGEEFLFRGVMQPLLGEFLGVAISIAMTSVIFGLLHAMTKTYAVLAFLVSVYFGWLAVVTNNLLPPVVAHAAYDFFALVYLTRRSSEPELPPI